MPRGKAMKRANGTGSIVKLSGNRRKPYEVRVNTRINEWGYPVYDRIGYYDNRLDAEIALADYNKSPFDVNKREISFAEVYSMWFDWKYVKSTKEYSKSSIDCSKGAFKKCEILHNRKIKELRTGDMQQIIDNPDLSHAYIEHIVNLLHQVFKYALEYDIIEKDYSSFLKINKEEDDEPGVPFSKEDIIRLWKHVDTVPYCDTILILIYTGWRISEFLGLKTSNIDMTEHTMKSGVKTAAGKNRIVPIHSGIQHLVDALYSPDSDYFIVNPKNCTTKLNSPVYYKAFAAALKECGITEPHTPHDCRHTFTSLLDSAGANEVCIDRLVGHASKTLTKRTYTHKDIDELRNAIELIEIPTIT